MLMAWSHAFTETAGKLLIGLCSYGFTPRSISFLTSEHLKNHFTSNNESFHNETRFLARQYLCYNSKLQQKILI